MCAVFHDLYCNFNLTNQVKTQQKVHPILSFKFIQSYDHSHWDYIWKREPVATTNYVETNKNMH